MSTPADFTPLFESALDFVKTIVVQTEEKYDTRMESEDLAELLMDTIRHQDDSALKRRWMRVRRNTKREVAYNFAEEANAIRSSSGWQW